MAEATTEEWLQFWCTRDTASDGQLSELVDVWLAKPSRINLPGGGAVWLGPGETGLEQRYAQWTLAATLKNCRTIPATSWECIVSG